MKLKFNWSNKEKSFCISLKGNSFSRRVDRKYITVNDLPSYITYYRKREWVFPIIGDTHVKFDRPTAILSDGRKRYWID